MKTLLGATCLAVAAGILVAGLWPFHSPRNEAAWRSGGNGLQFGGTSTAVSVEHFHTAEAQSSCAIEVWAQTASAHDSNTILAFHTAANPRQLSLEQSDTDLDVRRNVAHDKPRDQPKHFYIDAFRTARPRFITVSSGLRGTAVYLEGVLVRSNRNLRISAADCTGKLIVGTSPVGNAPWAGELRGLAIYHQELTPAQVRRHYETWTKKGRPASMPDERCVALYLFREGRGRLVHSENGQGPNLMIPETYRIEDQDFLEPFWKQFDLPDTVMNVLGFVPFGFFIRAWLSFWPTGKRRVLITVLLGAVVSFTIEVLQAHLPTRHSDSTDIISNTIGTWVGALLFPQAGRSGPHPFQSSAQ